MTDAEREGTLQVDDAIEPSPMNDVAGQENLDVNERKTMEASLRHSERRFRAIFDGVNDGLLVADAATRKIILANAPMREMLGYSRHEMLSLSIIDIHPTDSRDQVEDLLAQVQRGDHAQARDLPIQHKDGRVFFAVLNAVHLNLDGQECVLGAFRDVTERKKLASALEESANRYQRILETIHDIVFETQLDGTIIDISPAIEKTLQYSREELIGTSALNWYQDPADRSRFLELIVREERLLDYQVNFQCKDGTPIPYSMSVALVRDAAGEPSRLIGCLRDVSDRVRAAEALRISEEKYRGLYENAPQGYQSLDWEGCVLDVNPAWLRTLGYQRSEVIGHHFTDFLHPDWHEAFAVNFRAFKERGFIRDRQFKLLHADGHFVEVEFNGSIGFNPDGTFRQTYCVFQDVTERKRAIDALRDRERALTRAQALAGVGSWEFDLSTGTAYASEQARQIYGLPEGELTIAQAQAIPLPEYRSTMDLAMRDLVENGAPYDVEFEIRRPSDGATRHIHSIADYDPKRRIVTGAIQDVTQSRAMERDILRRETTYRTLVEGLPDIIMRFDRNGRHIFASDNSRVLTALPPSDIEGKTQRELGFPDTVCRFWDEQIQGALAGGEIREAEFTIERDGEKKYFGVRVVGEENANGEIESALAIIRDLTETKRMTETIRQMEKMDAIGQLAGGVAHDFNNQLAAIMGYGEILRTKLDDPDLQNYVDSMLRGASRSADLTRQLLAFSRKSDHRSALTDIHQIIREVIGILSRSIDKRIDLQYQLEARQCTVLGDPTQIQNALLNLGVNARDAIRARGTIVFTTRLTEINQDECGKMPQQIEAGRYIEIEVRDTGCGMTDGVRKHLFEPFFTTKGVGKGTGMGLATTYGTIRQHGGAISVASELHRGSCFTIHLPLATAVDAMNEEEGLDHTALAGRRILVIDDEEMIRSMTVDMLDMIGCTAHAVTSGTTGVEYFREHWSDVDVVMLDMLMPGINGHETFLELRTIDPEVRVLIASGYSSVGAAERLLQSGAMGFLQKPFRQRQLIEALLNIVEDPVQSPGN